MKNNKLLNYNEAKKENQCVCCGEYTFVMEALQRYAIIFYKEFALIEMPILNIKGYNKITNYWYNLTKKAYNEEREEREYKDYYEMLEMDF